MKEKLDRRKQYTRMVLKKSLLQLMSEKSFSEITVKEICELADINRSTFYAHYLDQYDLLETIEEEIIADLEQYLQKYRLQRNDDDLQMTVKLMEYLSEERDVVLVLLTSSGESKFERKVKRFAQEFLMKEWTEKENISASYSHYMSTFIISGSIQVIKSWLIQAGEESPETIARLIHSQINYGITYPYES